LKRMDQFIHFAVAASHEALTDAGLRIPEDEAESVGVYIGSSIGGFSAFEREHTKMMEGGYARVSPFFIPSAIINVAAGYVSMRYGAKGPNLAIATACSSGTNAIGESFRIIQRGDAMAMICGGSESAVTPLSLAGFASMRALSMRNVNPSAASCPFDNNRDGFVMGEGAGILVLEDLEHAVRRGARIYAELVGYGTTSDAHHITAPSADGDGAMRVIHRALQDAGVDSAQVDYINAHGSSTPIGDRIETWAVKRAFGKHAYRLAISSTKSMTGHVLGGAGGIEAGITALAIYHQTLPPTINLETPDPECDLDYVPCLSRSAEVNYALSNSFGFGGTNASLLFKRYDLKLRGVEPQTL
jgi:3-oxoacyl-[acyl-carrier-protein] synthase II